LHEESIYLYVRRVFYEDKVADEDDVDDAAAAE